MASFPEVVLRVTFRWQQFNKYMVPTVAENCVFSYPLWFCALAPYVPCGISWWS